MCKDWWKCSPTCQSCGDYENCDEPCAMAINFLQGNTDNAGGEDCKLSRNIDYVRCLKTVSTATIHIRFRINM